MEIDKLRKKINKIDSKIIRLIDERVKVVKKIGKIKKKAGIRVFQPAREKIVLEKVSKQSKNKRIATKIFKKIMSESRKIQETL